MITVRDTQDIPNPLGTSAEPPHDGVLGAPISARFVFPSKMGRYVRWQYNATGRLGDWRQGNG